MAPLGHVYAFEPAEYARSVMTPALRLSGLKNVTLIAKGLSDTPGEMTLHTPLKRSGSMGFGIAHMGCREEAGPTVDQIVEVTTLDAFAQAQGLTRLDFIKADVEGWELRALKGGEGCLGRFAPALFLEVDAPFLARAGDTPGALFVWLASLGYGAVRIPSLIPAPAYAGAGDYLFTHAEKP
jgi:FkbM family methyltransferase